MSEDVVECSCRDPRPVIQVVKGRPTDEEVAALVTVLRPRRWRAGGCRPCDARPVGTSGRQAALLDLQLAARDPGGARTHAAMTRARARRRPRRAGSGCCARPGSIRWSSSRASTRTRSSRRCPSAPMPRRDVVAPRPGQGRAGRTALDAAVAADCVVIGCDSMLYLDGRLWRQTRIGDAARASGSRWPAGPASCYTGHCVIRLGASEVIDQEAESSITDSAISEIRRPMTWRPTWPAVSRWRSPAASPSTAWAVGSSTASTATRPT